MKFRIIFLTIFLLTFLTNGYGQKPALIPFSKSKQWGFADTSCSLVIKPVWDSVTFFSLHASEHYYAKVQKNGKWGLIDVSGKLTIPAIYDSIGSFLNDKSSYKRTNLFLIKHNGMYGIVNINGETVLNPEYTEFDCIWSVDKNHQFKSDCICSKNEKYYLFHQDSLSLTETSAVGYKKIASSELRLEDIQIIDEEFVETNFNAIQELNPEDNYLLDSISIMNYYSVVFYKIYKNGKVGLTNDLRHYSQPTKVPIVYPIYDEIYEIQIFQNDVFLLINVNGKMGVVNQRGDFFIDPVYDTIENWSCFGGITTVNGKKGVIENKIGYKTEGGFSIAVKNGQFLIPNIFDEIVHVHELLLLNYPLWFVRKGNQYFYVDQFGRMYKK